jgi:hypothetical protein
MIIDIDPIELKTDAAPHSTSSDSERLSGQFSNLALHLSTTPSLPA